MPFTTAHPAVILQLKQIWPRWFSLSGLIAGAMSPDLLFFLALNTSDRGLSHSWMGLVVFCLPVGLVFCFAFHWLFKYQFIIHLPSPLDRLFGGLAETEFKPKSLRSIIVLVTSVFVGAMSHFFWDSFTHADGEIARWMPFLLDTTVVFGHSIQYTHIAQLVSTVLGQITVIIYAFNYEPLRARENWKPIRTAKQKMTFWFVCTHSSILFTASVVALFDRYVPHLNEHIIQTYGLAHWAGFFYAVVVWGLVKRVRFQSKS